MIRIYGASDDLVCLEGDLSEEFYPGYDNKPSYLSFSDGTVLSIAYTGGFWRIHRLATGTADYTNVEAFDPDGEYSDQATLDGDVRWVVFGSNFELIRKRAA